MPEVTLTQRDNGRSVTIGPSDSLRITVNENPSTGFRWIVEGADNETLELLSSDYVPATSLMPGATGQHVWRFKAKSPGDVRLLLKHWRSWGGEKSVVERLEFAIHVKKQ